MNYGFNGENWFKGQNEVSKQWVIDAIPAGGSFTLRFRADKPEFEISELDKLVDLSTSFRQQGKYLKVIYCINVKELPDIQVQNLTYVLEHNVDVIAVEFGNETYSREQANFVFATYQAWFEPLKTRINALYPTMKLLVFLAPRAKDSGVLGGRGEHKTWNDAAFAYIKADPSNTLEPTVHIYFNDAECPVSAVNPEKRLFDPSVFYQDLHDFYTTLYNQAQANLNSYEGNLWDSTLSYIEYNLPGHEIYITEWGFNDYGSIKNTIGTGITAWNIWLRYGKDTRINSLLQHNGISLAGPGMIFPVHSTNDLNPEGLESLRRVDYWVFKLFMEIANKSILMNSSVIELPGTYYMLSGTQFEHNINLEITNVTTSEFGYTYLYDSSGATEWMLKNSVPSYKIDGTMHEDDMYSIGYFVVTLDIVTPINQEPIAVISGGTTLNLYVGDSYTLDGSNSVDPEGGPLLYRWISGSATTISYAPLCTVDTTKTGTFVYYLEVTDNAGAKNTDSVTVIITEKPCKRPWYCSFMSWARKCKC